MDILGTKTESLYVDELFSTANGRGSPGLEAILVRDETKPLALLAMS